MPAIEKITDEEIAFMECWFYPPAAAATLFSNFDNLTIFDEKFGYIRNYQLPFMAYDPIIDEQMPGLSEKEKFNLKRGASECYNNSGRRIGKSLIAVKIDILLALLYNDNSQEGITSCDQIHLQNILDPVGDSINFHPIIKMWKHRTKGSPKYVYNGRNGYQLSGINMNVSSSKTAGQQFYGYHLQRLIIEESSTETDVVYDKRKDAISELGVIIRSSGMANFTRHTPAGKSYYNPENRNKILALPQYINSLFDEKEMQERIKEYGGKESFSYQMFVEAQPCEDGLSLFDITRINPFINDKHDLKIFEIKKDQFPYFKNLITVIRPPNADRIFIAGDIGDGVGGSEIVIFSEVESKYNYLYRISLSNIKDDEQTEILNWLIEKLQANVAGLDCGDGTGRSIMRRLEKQHPIDNLVKYAGTSKIGVGFAKDDKGNQVFVDGKPQFHEEFMSEWSVQWLKAMLYEGRILMPQDYKFISQINSVISHVVGTRTVYDCVSSVNGRKDDHVFDAFKVFSIMVWLKHDFNATPKMKSDSGVGTCSWGKKKEVNVTLKEQIKNKQEISCSAEEFRAVRNYIINESTRADFAGDKEKTNYLSKELNRLTKLFTTQ
jgi:hypothetical protein